MTKECLCGMATSKISSNLQGMLVELMFAKTNAKASERVYLNDTHLLTNIDDIERASDKAVINCGIPKSFSDNVKEHTYSMKNIVNKKTHGHGDVMSLNSHITNIEDSLDMHLKQCAKK